MTFGNTITGTEVAEARRVALNPMAWGNMSRAQTLDAFEVAVREDERARIRAAFVGWPRVLEALRTGGLSELFRRDGVDTNE